MKIYYSIRVVKAKNQKKAIEKICDEKFIEDHDLSDKVLTEEELKTILNKVK